MTPGNHSLPCSPVWDRTYATIAHMFDVNIARWVFSNLYVVKFSLSLVAKREAVAMFDKL